MMRRMTPVTMITLIAAVALATGCGSDTGNTGGGGGTTDTAAGSDSAGGGGDAATSDGTGGSDAGGGDTASGGDTATGGDTAGSDLCAANDQLCIASCRNEKCGKEYNACTTNSKCVGFNSCAGGCSQTPPVSPPAEVTGTTCIEKCATLAGEEAVKTYQSVVLCVTKSCVESPYTPGEKCAQSDEACLQACIVAKCASQSTACDSDKDCTAIFSCASSCGAGNQACVQGCFSKAPIGAQQKFQAFLSCAQTYCI
jgi:hypothetical protein